MNFYDVVIVGGGPSGVSLGVLLQKAGISNCIIDKAIFPRDKVCGGLLTEKTVSLIEDIYGKCDFPYESITSSVELFLGTNKLSSTITESKYYLVERKRFDNYLIEQYKSCGGIIYEGKHIQEILQEEKKIKLDDGIDVRYNVLVGADGANSQIRKIYNCKYRPNAVCVEANYPDKKINNSICIYFATVSDGYGWCFPKRKSYSIGIGGLIKYNKDIKKSFVSFANSIDKGVDIKKIKGASIPFGNYIKKPCFENIILIGDAAGLVDPITGEGLYFAFLSSIIAYRSIRSHLFNKTQLDKTYNKHIKAIHSIIDNANCFKKIFFNERIKLFFLRMIEGHENITKFFCDNILSNYNVSYMGFPFTYLGVRCKRKIKEYHNMVDDEEK